MPLSGESDAASGYDIRFFSKLLIEILKLGQGRLGLGLRRAHLSVGAGLQPRDIRASRILVCDPAPIPLDEMQRTSAWLRSWDCWERPRPRSSS
jgi:hypothetical protein